MTNRIGWIGLGRMGEAMVKRLLKAGHDVTVWNRTASKAAPLADYGALDYTIIVNWVIAEHKTQGTMQLGVNRGDVEEFWWFDMNDTARFDETTRLFRRLAEPFFEELRY